MPRPPPPFHQRLVKKTEDGKYRHFITTLKQLSINVPLVEALEQMSGYYERSGYKEKIGHFSG